MQSKRLGLSKANSPASCAIAPSVDSLSREQSVPLLRCFVLPPAPWDPHSARMPQSDGCNVLEQWLGCFLQGGVLGSPQPAWEALSHVFMPSLLQLSQECGRGRKASHYTPPLPRPHAYPLIHSSTVLTHRHLHACTHTTTSCVSKCTPEI